MIVDWLHALATGVQFLTRLPVPGGASGGDPLRFARDAPRALMLFPVIGGLIGAVTALVAALAAAVWPFPLAVLLALAVEALLTGGLHEDAVADFCDAFGGGATTGDVLRILRDSRIGSYGLLGLGFALALRAAGLIACGTPARAALVLVVSGAMGRLAILAVMARVPPVAGRPGLAGAIAPRTAGTVAWAGAGLALPIAAYAAVVAPRGTAFSLLGGAIFVAWFPGLLKRRIGGSTGDCLGFAGYAGTVITTLAFAVRR